MNFINPHFFAAVLETVPHRFILIQECECLHGFEGFQPPRFSVGAINATRDPRFAQFRQLVGVGVTANTTIQIPSSWLMAHQYIYMVHDKTDKDGWQYRSTWPIAAIPSVKEEQWGKDYISHFHFVRRRIWMATIVPREDLLRARRLLSSNIQHMNQENDSMIKLQGDLFRCEQGTVTKAWNKRRVLLFHNRMEFYSGNNKKGEISLHACEVKMLTTAQCQGRNYAFSIRNAAGNVAVLLDADDLETRRDWVFAIQYQLAQNSEDMNFSPLPYAPPTTGESVDNRVILSSDLKMLAKDGQTWLTRHFQLIPREIVCFNEMNEMKGRIFVDQATLILDAAKDSCQFTIKAMSGILLCLSAAYVGMASEWIESIRKQINHLENERLKRKTTPKEEYNYDVNPMHRKEMFYDERWTAPRMEGEEELYWKSVFTAHVNHPEHFEFNEDLQIWLNFRTNQVGRERSGTLNSQSDSSRSTVMQSPSAETPLQRTTSSANMRNSDTISNAPTTNNIVHNQNFCPSTSSNHSSSAGMMVSSSSKEKKLAIINSITNAICTTPVKGTQRLQSTAPIAKYLDANRLLLNPRFMLSCLKTINHRFVLVLECEFCRNAPSDVKDQAPSRFSVGGPRASKDPRIVSLNQLLGISNRQPEIQFPPGWFTLHPYMYIVQQNTDDQGWQYRSTWSDGTVGANEEPWTDNYDLTKYVRRRMWMTTVVRKDDMMKAKALVAESIHKPRDDVIYQEYLYVCHATAAGNNNKSDSLISSAVSIMNSTSKIALPRGSWGRCKVILYHKKLEFYNGFDKVGDVNLVDCEVRPLPNHSMQTMQDVTNNREHIFSMQHPLTSLHILFQCDNHESRLRWLKALSYQLLVIIPDLNFETLSYSPPTGLLPEQRVLYCGDLQILDSNSLQWETFQIHLHEQMLVCRYRSDSALYGRLPLEGAMVRTRDDEYEFTLRVHNGCLIYLRAENTDSRTSWMMAIRRCVERIKMKKRSKSNMILDLEESIQTCPEDGCNSWDAIEKQTSAEEEDYLQSLRVKYNSELSFSWPTISLASVSKSSISRQNSFKSELSPTINHSSGQSTVSGSTSIAKNTKTMASDSSNTNATSLSQTSSKISVTSYVDEDEISDADFEVHSQSSKLSLAGRPHHLLIRSCGSMSDVIPEHALQMESSSSNTSTPTHANASRAYQQSKLQQAQQSPLHESQSSSVRSLTKPFPSAHRISSTTSDSNDEVGEQSKQLQLRRSSSMPSSSLTMPMSATKLSTSNISLSNVRLRQTNYIERVEAKEKPAQQSTELNIAATLHSIPQTFHRAESVDDDWDKDFPMSEESDKLYPVLPNNRSSPPPTVMETRFRDHLHVQNFKNSEAIRNESISDDDAGAARVSSVREKILLFGEKAKSPLFPQKSPVAENNQSLRRADRSYSTRKL